MLILIIINNVFSQDKLDHYEEEHRGWHKNHSKATLQNQPEWNTEQLKNLLSDVLGGEIPVQNKWSLLATFLTNFKNIDNDTQMNLIKHVESYSEKDYNSNIFEQNLVESKDEKVLDNHQQFNDWEDAPNYIYKREK